MENMKEVVSKNFNRFMEASKPKQRALANSIKVNENSIGRWLRGTSLPEMDNIQKLADFFGVPWQEFFRSDYLSTPKVEPMSHVLNRALTIPDSIYEFAGKIPESHRKDIWDAVEGLIEESLIDIEEERKTRSKG